VECSRIPGVMVKALSCTEPTVCEHLPALSSACDEWLKRAGPGLHFSLILSGLRGIILTFHVRNETKANNSTRGTLSLLFCQLGVSECWGEELHHPDVTLSRAAAPLHRKESAEVVHPARMPLFASLWRFSGQVQLGPGPGEDPELTAGIVYPIWGCLWIPSRSWRGMSGFPCWTCWLHNPISCQSFTLCPLNHPNNLLFRALYIRQYKLNQILHLLQQHDFVVECSRTRFIYILHSDPSFLRFGVELN